MDRLVWTPREVVDVDGPRAMLRAYLEQRDVREFCASVILTARIEAACDVGCGFGRLTPVLTEFAERVVGFEREAGLLTVAQSLQPSIEFRTVETLAHLPADNGSFAFALVFTVLQHIPEPAVHTVIGELQRIVAPGGHLLLCEETDETLEAGDRAAFDARREETPDRFYLGQLRHPTEVTKSGDSGGSSGSAPRASACRASIRPAPRPRR
jgi:SAM-dependent methyltransferase